MALTRAKAPNSPDQLQAMISKSEAIPVIMQKLQKLPSGHGLDLRSYKRNRSVLIIKTQDQGFWIQHRGFYQDCFYQEPDKMKKELKAILRKEFPRSTKLRVYALDREQVNIDWNKYLKKL